ncbi:phytoene/squalene synthase family protein [Kordiimonas aestuarii]|uniref:phytoene/squalene synthase family protein n=1 Tax=Kordiimonas aestuarii TaxID=1005925 RepID=UPI0021D2CE08|nr:squalene/phytoene synthase family protein [Kordiimonas aestuarii]
MKGKSVAFNMANRHFRAMKPSPEAVEFCRNMVREDDLERYYTTLFAPAQKQADLWALFAFNQEVAKTRESVSEPMIGEIRLQWWREALEGISHGMPREHPVVQGLRHITVYEEILPLLETVIDGRGQDLEMEKTADINALIRYADSVGGALNEAAARILKPGATDSECALVRSSGRAWAMLGIIRALPYQVQDTKTFSVIGATTESVSGMPVDEMEKQLRPLTTEMAAYVRQELAKAQDGRGVKAIRPVLALNSLTKLHLRAFRKAGDSPFGMHELESGNLRKLVALTFYHLF